MNEAIKAGPDLIAHNLVFEWQHGGTQTLDRLERLIAEALQEARLSALKDSRKIMRHYEPTQRLKYVRYASEEIEALIEAEKLK